MRMKTLNNLDKLDDWPEVSQDNAEKLDWSFRRCLLKFNVHELEDFVEVFTTRPDTLLEVTFLALSPEHPIVKKLPVMILLCL